MPEVVLNIDDITIFAPPDNIEVQVDVGAQGERGSRFFVGSGDPSTITVDGKIDGQTILPLDLFINTTPSGESGYVYQYISAPAEPSGYTWELVYDINPTIYSKINATTFTSGDGTITIPLSDIVPGSVTGLDVDNFNVKYSIENQYPIASSMELSATSSDLSITIHAIKYSSSTWSNLTGTTDVHLQITQV